MSEVKSLELRLERAKRKIEQLILANRGAQLEYMRRIAQLERSTSERKFVVWTAGDLGPLVVTLDDLAYYDPRWSAWARDASLGDATIVDDTYLFCVRKDSLADA